MDASDFAHLQTCFNGSDNTIPPSCNDADLNGDTSVDNADFTIYLPCMAGPDHTPGC